MFPIYDLSHLNAILEILSHFHGLLNIENDSADEASVYLEHILVDSSIEYIIV